MEVVTLIPVRTVLRAKATTAANADTQSELDGLKNDWVAFDVTASTGTNGIFSIDEDEGKNKNSSIIERVNALIAKIFSKYLGNLNLCLSTQ